MTERRTVPQVEERSGRAGREKQADSGQEKRRGDLTGHRGDGAGGREEQEAGEDQEAKRWMRQEGGWVFRIQLKNEEGRARKGQEGNTRTVEKVQEQQRDFPQPGWCVRPWPGEGPVHMALRPPVLRDQGSPWSSPHSWLPLPPGSHPPSGPSPSSRPG